jgi:hypothetical protein
MDKVFYVLRVVVAVYHFSEQFNNIELPEYIFVITELCIQIRL